MSRRTLVIVIAGILFGAGIGWVLFPMALYSSDAQPVNFSHKVHTGEQAGLPCENCHEFSADGRFSGVPALDKCTGCHGVQLGSTDAEKKLVEEYVTPGKTIPWLVYSRQPDNAYFSHATHVKMGDIACEDCHGPHGGSDSLLVYQANRLTGYSRDIWGRNISGVSSQPWEGMKMDRCVRCHAERGRKDGCIACHK